MARPKGSKNKTTAEHNGGEVKQTRRRRGRSAGTPLSNSTTAGTTVADQGTAIAEIGKIFSRLNPQEAHNVLNWACTAYGYFPERQRAMAAGAGHGR